MKRIPLTIEGIEVLRSKSSKRVRLYKRMHFMNLPVGKDIENRLADRIEQMAEEEAAMSRYEHGQEVA